MEAKILPMKRAMRAALFVLLLSVAGMTKGYAYDFSAVCETGQTLYYNITDSINHYVSLTYPGTLSYSYYGYNGWAGYTQPTGNITLPSTVDYDGVTYTVTSIGDYAFASCIGLTGQLVIPDSVISIGNYAFSYCYNLGNGDSGWNEPPVTPGEDPWEDEWDKSEGSTDDLIIGNSVTTIGDYAFAYCRGLKGGIVIPDSVISIGNYAFYEFGSSGGNEPPDAPIVEPEDEEFKKSEGSADDLIIGNSVTTIGDYAFAFCSRLTGSLEIPNSVISIGTHAFRWCKGLTGSLEIPNSVTSIGDYAFSNCVGLNQIIVDDDNLYYDSRENCNALIETATNTLITGCKNSFIPNSVISIGNTAFADCRELVSLTIPYSVTSIASSAFYGCSGLEQINVDEGNSYYDSRENCNATIETSTNTLVIGCKNTVIPNSVTSIGDHAFDDCIGLTSITIPNSVISIKYCAFDGCIGLTSITIPDSVTFIGAYAFRGCSGLTSLTIPNSVTTIDYDAFSYCSGLTSLTIGASVTSIGDHAFYLCSGLASMTILADNPPTLYYSYYTFYNVDKSIPVYVPCGAKEAYQNANAWKQFTNIQEVCAQTVTLSVGWNWYSTYIEQEGIDGLSQLENSIGIPRARIESKSGDYVRSKVRNGRTVWVGALTSINNEEMYKIGTKETCTATMEGIATDPALHPITINRGWNWIGFPCSESVSVSEALSGFSPKNNDMIKGRNGSATYSNGTWSGTLNTLEPGQGYMYGSKSNATKTLVFQTGSRGGATLANITPENNYYQPAADYADNMTVIAVVDLNGEELHSDDYELAAFVGDECRGSVKMMYVEAINRYIAFLTVFGDEAEDLRFMLTDGATSDLSVDHLTYAIDGIEGSLDNPVVLRFGATDVSENAAVNVRIYPNPSEDLFNIEGNGIRRIEVVNVYGQVILTKEVGDYSAQIDLGDNAAGIYLLRVVTDGGITTSQIVKR